MMNSTLLKLKMLGCDIDGALDKFLGDEDLLLDCIKQVLSDENFEFLGNALKKHNAENTFDFAHTLKGIIANTGISPLYSVIVDIVEVLRKGNTVNLEENYDSLLNIRDELKKQINRGTYFKRCCF